MAVAEDPVEAKVREELAADGINLDELLNAGKVVSLTRKLEKLVLESTHAPVDSDAYKEIQKNISKIQSDIVREKRQVMQLWLKRLFLSQAVLFLAIGGILSNDALPGYSVPLVGQALGFWMTWLFTIPALRARKGTKKSEKSALNISFLTIPFLNVGLAAATKNCGTIWTADVLFLAGCYVFYGVKSAQMTGTEDEGIEREEGKIKGVLKYLDWGSWR